MLRKSLPVLVVAAALAGCSLSLFERHEPAHEVTPAERLALLRRAQVWKATTIADMDVATGPPDRALPPEADVACDYSDVRYGGNTPKFGCALTPEVTLKVRYGRDNGELYAGVAATRLLWLMGFGADAMYPVQVLCRRCPTAYAAEGTAEPGAVRFDRASVEWAFPGRKIEAPGDGGGWAWDELDLVDPAAGGAPLAERDALKLLAVLIQHSDSKPEQQRLVCQTGGKHHEALAACADPFMLIHDVGQTFGRANVFNRSAVGSVNFDLWSKTPVWRDAARCVGNLAASNTGTLSDPRISEGGRAFLSGLLSQISDRQLRDLFAVARFDKKPSGSAPIDAWVSAFRKKAGEIASAHCPS